ncbi:unnamed protein product [Leptidea sinapis]|uniref:Sulfotransferase domain-containing protein n=1 Tax=Leptidea sinapis TaxID=189913 RepID=A0A5E4PSP6_9NEOP|nr:unnamed protein product [Leptidea sinapis]
MNNIPFTLNNAIKKFASYKNSARNLASILGINFGDEFEYRRLKKTSVSLTKKLPDALIIGVKKCGTRALLEFIREKMPATLEGQVTMEKTPSYWVTKTAPKRVHAMNPAVKLIAVVRDPVTRAIMNSSVRWGGTWSVDASWPPVRIGIYSRPYRRWLRWFPKERLLLVNGERLVVDPAAEIARVQDFLGLKRVITDKHFYFNSTKGFPCLLKSETKPVPHCLGKTKGRNHPHIDISTISKLKDFYRPHNEKFYKISGINFKW